MSSRHLKKVYGESLTEELKSKVRQQSQSDEEELHPFGSPPQRKTFVQNPYELLNLAEDDVTEETSEHDQQQEESEKDTDIQQQTPGRKKKKKKHRGKNKKNSDGSLSAASDTPTANVTTAPVTLQLHHHRVMKTKDKDKLGSSSGSMINQTNLFSPEPKYLNTEYELKNIFGASVINKELGKSGRGNRKRHTALGRIVTPKDKWPSVANSGISMSVLEPKEIGIEHFKFEHNTFYQDIQKSFFKAVDSHDPENILSIIRLHPYHVDSQIQLSEMSKQSEDSQVAAELVEMAMHAMELVVHPRFSLSSTNCRLEYKYQENRAFHILLYKHINFVSQRACHRTALELSKILLNLDPSDPLCVTLMLDFFAIKAGQCQWLVDVYNLWNGNRNLSQLPNWSYSVALAQFLLSIGAESRPMASSHTASTSTQGESNYTGTDTNKEMYGKLSDELLQYSFLMFPSIVVPLLDKCGINCDPKFKNHSYFNYQAQHSTTDPLRLLANLYLWRSWHLWRNPAILEWIERNAMIVLRKIESKDPVLYDYEAKRRRRYQEGTTPRNVLRHLFLIGEKEVTMNIPPSIASEVILAHDPLPPRDSVDIYRREERPLRLGSENAPGFLQALLQSFRIDMNAGMHNLEEAAAAGGAAAVAVAENPDAEAGAFHRSVNTFIDAMRNLLAVATSDDVRNPNNQRDGEADSSSSEELPDID